MLNRPKIICHMLMSVDGKVTGRFLNNTDLSYANEYYYEINRNSNSSFLCGRVTMEEIFTQGYYPNLEKYKNIFVPKGDYISYEKGVFFAIAIDPSGKLGWRKNKIEDSNPGYNGKTIIEVLTEKAPKEYLAYLRSINISYILCGEEIIDLKLALKKLYHGFGINKILIQGGSKTNSEFINLNLVDELSLVVAPVISEKNTKPLFDSNTFTKFQLESVETKRDIIHLKYYNNNENTYYVCICNDDLNLLLKNTNNILTSSKELTISYTEAIKTINPQYTKISYEKQKNDTNNFSFIKCEKELINPIFLNYLPVILNINDNVLKNILSRKNIAVLDKNSGMVNFVKLQYLDKFSEEKYQILTIVEFIRNRLNTIDINNPSTKKQKEFFEIFKENNMELSDIFIDKIIVSPYINFLIENKKEDSNLLSIAFLKLLLRCERLSKIISENAPNLIIEFETILAQDALNNYYQIIKDYMN